jgi:hypothetical protein
LVLQVVDLFDCQLEHKISRKPIPIALHGPIEHFSFYSVQLSKVFIEHDFLPPQQEYSLLNMSDGQGRSFNRHTTVPSACAAPLCQSLMSQFATSK